MIIQTTKDLPSRRAYDLYPTPLPFAKAALSGLDFSDVPREVIDPGAGSGVWGQAFFNSWGLASIAGYEIRDIPRPKNYNSWIVGDFLDQTIQNCSVDLVMGNPPYYIAEKIVWKSMDALKCGGWLVFMLRLSFLESKKRLKLWDVHPLKKVVVCANRPSFTKNGKTNATAYAFYYWKKGYRGPTDLSWIYVEKENTNE